MSNILTLSEQVDRLVVENQNLRVKSENDDVTIHLLKEQYATLSGQVRSIREGAVREVERARQQRDDTIQDMQMERDQAVIAYREIETLLLRATDNITQALRARVGNSTPEKMPQAEVQHISDNRLPPVAIQ
jgi:hypothetical protein